MRKLIKFSEKGQTSRFCFFNFLTQIPSTSASSVFGRMRFVHEFLRATTSCNISSRGGRANIIDRKRKVQFFRSLNIDEKIDVYYEGAGTKIEVASRTGWPRPTAPEKTRPISHRRIADRESAGIGREGSQQQQQCERPGEGKKESCSSNGGERLFTAETAAGHFVARHEIMHRREARAREALVNNDRASRNYFRGTRRCSPCPSSLVLSPVRFPIFAYVCTYIRTYIPVLCTSSGAIGGRSDFFSLTEIP